MAATGTLVGRRAYFVFVPGRVPALSAIVTRRRDLSCALATRQTRARVGVVQRDQRRPTVPAGLAFSTRLVSGPTALQAIDCLGHICTSESHHQSERYANLSHANVHHRSVFLNIEPRRRFATKPKSAGFFHPAQRKCSRVLLGPPLSREISA